MYPDLTFRTVSRLDKNTSGLVTVAKNKLAASKIMSDPRYRPVKTYLAVTSSDFTEKCGESGEVIAPIGREYVPELEVKELAQITLEMLSSLNQ